MLSHVFVSNVENCRLEAEVSTDKGDIIAVIYEDQSGWRVEEIDGQLFPIPIQLIEQIKAEMRSYVNRVGSDAPRDCTRGELALWLMLKDDGTAMGVPYFG
jgi:hypothetical protein